MRARPLGPLVFVAACFSETPGSSSDDSPADSGSGTGMASTSGDPTTSTSTAMTGGADSTTGVDDCPLDAVRVPPIPDGWSGVELVASRPSDAPPPMCPLSFDDVPLLLGPQTRPAPDCACDCDVDITLLCVLRLQLAQSCEAIAGADPMPVGGACIPDTPPAANLIAEGANFVPTPVPRYGDGVLWACGGGLDTACVRRPADFVGPCIRSTSETTCPAEYPEPLEAWTTECQPCMVPDTTAYCAEQQLDWFEDASCNGSAALVLRSDQPCTEDSTLHSLRLSPMPLSCPDTAGQTRRNTICCVPS